CQPRIQRKALVLQSLSSPNQLLERFAASLAVASSSIGACSSIEKINSSGLFPTALSDDSKYWCYIQV
ncbi:MAG: hypothetical protein RR897_24140, partial [Pseudomonas sp.]